MPRLQTHIFLDSQNRLGSGLLSQHDSKLGCHDGLALMIASLVDLLAEDTFVFQSQSFFINILGTRLL